MVWISVWTGSALPNVPLFGLPYKLPGYDLVCLVLPGGRHFSNFIDPAQPSGMNLLPLFKKGVTCCALGMI
jgi:hypothetical protein